jgi:heme exporter protein D
MKFEFGVPLALLTAFIPLISLIVAVIGDRERRKKSEKPPQVEKLLRPPGHSLSLRLDKTLDQILDDVFTACGLSAIAGLCAVTLGKLLAGHAPFSWLAICILVLAMSVIASAWSTIKAFRGFKEAQNIRLGLRGEQAVAEALSEAADSGFRAFHDLPGGENWNIDHVAVSTRGVFLLETKARRRRASRNGQPAHEVNYDGEALQFPTGKETKPVEQAKRNAAWLSNYLAKKTGEPVRVDPLIILPGWFVRFSEKGCFPVKAMNANYLVRFLAGQAEIIPPAQVRRIITALDEKCRDLEF